MTRTAPTTIATPPAPPIVRYEDVGYARMAEVKRTNPQRYERLRAEREFRRELGFLGMTDEQIVAALQRRKATGLIARFTELREALRQ
jgi:hypothetical protein